MKYVIGLTLILSVILISCGGGGSRSVPTPPSGGIVEHLTEVSAGYGPSGSHIHAALELQHETGYIGFDTGSSNVPLRFTVSIEIYNAAEALIETRDFNQIVSPEDGGYMRLDYNLPEGAAWIWIVLDYDIIEVTS